MSNEEMSGVSATGLEMRLLPDSPDARLYIELAGYRYDLNQAHDALTEAAQPVDTQERWLVLRDVLVDYAAVAYCRTYFPSNVRRSMLEYLEVPQEFADVHSLISLYRNRRVAHSHSTLDSSFVAIGIDPDDSVRPGLLSMTLAQPMPEGTLRHWLALIELLLDRLGALLDPVEARLLATVAKTPAATIRSWRPAPFVSHAPASEFDPRTKRAAYPTGVTVYWESREEPEP